MEYLIIPYIFLLGLAALSGVYLAHWLTGLWDERKYKQQVKSMRVRTNFPKINCSYKVMDLNA